MAGERKETPDGDEGGRSLRVEADNRRVTPGLAAARRGVKVEEVMTAETAVIRPEDGATDAARVMRDEGIGFLPVVEDDGTVVGAVTDRDLVVRLLAEGLSPATRVELLMTVDPVACHAGDDLGVAEELMQANQISRLVVLGDDDLLAGVVSLADVAQYEEECRVGRLVADVTEREAEPH
jgi:CBS domain-containing protein